MTIFQGERTEQDLAREEAESIIEDFCSAENAREERHAPRRVVEHEGRSYGFEREPEQERAEPRREPVPPPRPAYPVNPFKLPERVRPIPDPNLDLPALLDAAAEAAVKITDPEARHAFGLLVTALRALSEGRSL